MCQVATAAADAAKVHGKRTGVARARGELSDAQLWHHDAAHRAVVVRRLVLMLITGRVGRRRRPRARPHARFKHQRQQLRCAASAARRG
eukprot:359902-Chlamydomonas_euryale.AAC.3